MAFEAADDTRLSSLLSKNTEDSVGDFIVVYLHSNHVIKSCKTK